MNQCMQAAEQLSVNAHSIKRRLSNDQSESNPKRLATAERPEYTMLGSHYHYPHYQLPPPAPTQASILPRPASGERRDHPPQFKPDPPRKRGRPSRQDKAKRDLQPLLPRPSFPAASQLLHTSASPQVAGQGTIPTSASHLAPLAPKIPEAPSLLASPLSTGRPITPPEAYVPTVGGSASPRGSIRSSSPRGEQAGSSAYPVKEMNAARTTPHKRLLVE